MMTRVVKKPDIRRDEILQTAQALFYSKGFHKTSVRDIVKTLKIAQGTFYYYFSSKMDVLDKMTDKILDTIIESLKQVISTEMAPVEKLNTLFATTASIKMSNKKTMFILLRILYKTENVIIRHTMNEKTIRRAGPIYARVIQQGIEQGVFHIPCPDEAGIALMELIINTNESISRSLIAATEKEKKLVSIEKRMRLFSHIVEKILGIEPGTIRGFNIDHIQELISDET